MRSVLIRVNPWPEVLELSRVFLGPALDNNLLVGIELDRNASLAVEIAKKAVLPPAKRKVRHGRSDPDVDADVARRRLIAKAARRRSARCEQRRLIPVGTALQEGERFIHVIRVHQAQYRPEDFRICDFAGCRNIIKDGRLHEVAALALRNPRIAAIKQNFRPLLLSYPDERFHSFLTLRSDHRPHLNAIFDPVSDLKLRGSVRDRITKCLLRFSDCDRDGNSKAALPRTAEGAVADNLCGHGHVGIGQHDHVILRSSLTLATFALLSGSRVYVARNRSRSHEADGTGFGMINQSVYRRLAAIDEIHHTLRQPGLFEQFVHVAHGERHALARL